MSHMLKTAKAFQEACDAGDGWETCRRYCHDDATFTVQADVLAHIKTVQEYVEWAKHLLTPVPDGRAEVKFAGEDTDRGCVAIHAVFHGTQTGPGGPGEHPTGKSVMADYVYVMYFKDGLIRHVDKIWNDVHSLGQLGWA